LSDVCVTDLCLTHICPEMFHIFILLKVETSLLFRIIVMNILVASIGVFSQPDTILTFPLFTSLPVTQHSSHACSHINIVHAAIVGSEYYILLCGDSLW
jgi:hypothetical protein